MISQLQALIPALALAAGAEASGTETPAPKVKKAKKVKVPAAAAASPAEVVAKPKKPASDGTMAWHAFVKNVQETQPTRFAELKKHRIKCAVLPDRYAQSSALARDARVAVQVSMNLQGFAAKYTIAELSVMDWTVGEQGAFDEPADVQTRGPMLLHRNAEIDMGYGPDEEDGTPGAGNSDVESFDDHDPV